MRTRASIAAMLALAGCAYPWRPATLPPATLGADVAPTPTPATARLTAAPVTIVVALDGLRLEEIGAATPNLARLAAAGVAVALRPTPRARSYADYVAGSMAAGRRGQWDAPEPIWATAENAGVPVAAAGWPGTADAAPGFRPRDLAAPADAAAAPAWLERPVIVRPRLLLLRPEPDAGWRAADALVGALLAGRASANIVVISDAALVDTAQPKAVSPTARVPVTSSRRALMIAAGPAFATRTGNPAMERAALYPLIRRLIGLPAEPRQRGDAPGDPGYAHLLREG